MDIMEMGASDDLVSKWGPALDGIENDYTKRVTAQLLENQLKSVQNEQRQDEAAIGTGTTGEGASDTALETEITTGGGARASATCSRVTTSQTNDTAQLVYTWTFSSTFAVTESGVFDAAGPPPSGVMLCRKTFSAINVGSGDQLQITWKVQVSAT